ncbi:MAG: DUF4118 domain-containing protein [Magnetococcales bacterium]|nr:DUF4118 domain-containing protein [Magnetococcales bacterium]
MTEAENEENRERDRLLADTVSGPAWLGYALGLFSVVVTTGVVFWGRSWLTPPDLVMLYLLPIMAVAFRFGQGPSLVTSALSVAAYDFFFVHPYFTFEVSDSQYILTFTILFMVGLVISALMTRIRNKELEARERELQTEVLYHLSRDVISTLHDDEVAGIVVRHAARLFGGEAGIWLEDGEGRLNPIVLVPAEMHLSEQAMTMVRWCCDQGQSSGRGTQVFPEEEFSAFPIAAGRVSGAMVVRIRDRRLLGSGWGVLLEAFARQASLAIDRARLGTEAGNAAVRAQAEEMRAALLSMASHDLRTPLAAITGAGTALRDDDTNLDPSQQGELLETICSEAERMERLITNLLDMVRLESGACRLRCEWIPFEELLGSALVRLEKRCQGIKMVIHVDEKVSMLHLDAVLFEQVLVNLLDNALKYASADSGFLWELQGCGDRVVIRMADRGPGIPPGQEEQIFEKFVRIGRPGVPGSGLGLAICRGVVAAHQGTIRAFNRIGGGAEFRIELPQPPMPADLLVFEREESLP